MEAYEGYLENGRFFPIGEKVTIPGRRKVLLTLVDDPAPKHAETPQAKAWREFFEAVNNASDEEMAEPFERVSFTREFEL